MAHSFTLSQYKSNNENYFQLENNQSLIREREPIPINTVNFFKFYALFSIITNKLTYRE